MNSASPRYRFAPSLLASPLPMIALGAVALSAIALGCGGAGVKTSTPTVAYAPSVLSGVAGTTNNNIQRVSPGDIMLGFGAAGTSTHAIRLTTTGGVDLHSTFYEQTQATAASGTITVGAGYISNSPTALMWATPTSAPTPLMSSAFTRTYAYDVSGTTVVGYASTGSTAHAIAWTQSGTGMTENDIHPSSGFASSIALATSGSLIAGYGSGAFGEHALVWNGLTNSPVDIHPSGFNGSHAVAISGTSLVGFGIFGSEQHPLLWRTVSTTATDLTPTGFLGGQATAINGTVIAGSVYDSMTTHAALWLASTGAFTDLHTKLTGLKVGGVTVDLASSVATGVFSNGDIAGYAADTSGHTYPIIWKH